MLGKLCVSLLFTHNHNFTGTTTIEIQLTVKLRLAEFEIKLTGTVGRILPLLFFDCVENFVGCSGGNNNKIYYLDI